jgi:hypothetical protein
MVAESLSPTAGADASPPLLEGVASTLDPDAIVADVVAETMNSSSCCDNQHELEAQQLQEDSQSIDQPKVPPLTMSLTRLPEELPPQIREDFEVDMSVLGEGAYAAVRRLRHRQSGNLVALKVVEKYPLLIRNMLPQLHREVGLQGRLRHRNILQLLSCFEDETHVYMMLDYCAGGSLRMLASVQPEGRFPEGQAAWLFTQILVGVDFMHQSGVVHRDLKHENILLTANSEVRICDFGWSAEVQVEKALLTTCGTPHIWAPEIFEGMPQSFGTDLWALGNLIYELLLGHQPFWGSMEEIRLKVLSVDLRYPPELLSQSATHLFHCLLQRDPRCRISAFQLLTEHPWILPVVAELARLGIVSAHIPVQKQDDQLPWAHAAFEALLADAPIAMCINAPCEGSISFVPPVQQQHQAAEDDTHLRRGAPTISLVDGPKRVTSAEQQIKEEIPPSLAEVPYAYIDLSTDCDATDFVDLPLKDTVVHTGNLECPSTAPEVERHQEFSASKQVVAFEQPDAASQSDTGCTSSHKDSTLSEGT